ncbi:unnamed protein product [Cuscuta europaea]|uniref:Uncharacterized protein n=1 Tax=Cuscuta europaea TaxID=41803 RepID=A0A9P1ED16_CUSEU|nr:unnamed protein product [Cuscuta europaea]
MEADTSVAQKRKQPSASNVGALPPKGPKQKQKKRSSAKIKGARKVWSVLSCPLINLGAKYLPIHPRVERWVLSFLSFVIRCTFVLSPIYSDQVHLILHIIGL